MKKIFSKKEKAIRQAFQIYDSAKVKSAGRRQGEGLGYSEAPGAEMECYLEGFEESRMEERICRMIEKLPIENPKRKARRIWVCGVTAILLCVLAGWMVDYAKE